MRFPWNRTAIGATLLLAAVVPSGGAAAGNASALVDLVVKVPETCRVEAGSLNFGTYDPLVLHANAPLDAECKIIVSCTLPVSGSLNLQPLHGSAASAFLVSGSDQLAYSLFHDSGRESFWSGLALDGGGERSAEISVFGRIAAAQDVPSGEYRDTVTVRLDF